LFLLFTLGVTLAGPGPAAAAFRTVTSCGDSGPGTLRARVAAAGADDTILLPACTITLASQVTIATSLTLSGEGATRTILSGGGVTGVLNISGGTVTISGVTIRDGMLGPDGGGVNNSGTLTLLNSTVSGNSSGGNGGGLFNAGRLSLLNSAVSGN